MTGAGMRLCAHDPGVLAHLRCGWRCAKRLHCNKRKQVPKKAAAEHRATRMTVPHLRESNPHVREAHLSDFTRPRAGSDACCLRWYPDP